MPICGCYIMGCYIYIPPIIGYCMCIGGGIPGGIPPIPIIGYYIGIPIGLCIIGIGGGM
jgi:hypothetical protein